VGAAHLTPRVSAESAVKRYPLLPTVKLSNALLADPTKRSPFASITDS
jgi:hypothetical protein